MDELYRLSEKVKKELEMIAEKGLTTSNIDNAYKLVDMYKDLKEVEGMEDEGGYSERGAKRDRYGRYSRDGGYHREESYNHGGESYNYGGGNSYGGASYARGGDYLVKGHYSRTADESYNRYMDSKKDYRYSQSADCKQRLMETVDEYMNRFTQQMEEMLRDSDCAEERATIKRYLEKLRTIT